MERELQEYYEARFSTMATKGWQDFIEDTQNLFDTYNKINTAESFEEDRKSVV